MYTYKHFFVLSSAVSGQKNDYKLKNKHISCTSLIFFGSDFKRMKFEIVRKPITFATLMERHQIIQSSPVSSCMGWKIMFTKQLFQK